MQPLLQLYRIAKASGILSTTIGEAAFRRAYFAYKRHIEDPHERLLRANPELLAGGDVLDVGANIGYTAAVFARHADATARVWAFEPERWNFNALQHTVARLGFDGRIVPVNAIVGAEDGEGLLGLNPVHHGDHHVVAAPESNLPVQRVRLLTLDRFALDELSDRAVSLLKIDVQGYEPMVLRGAQRLLSGNPGIAVSTEVDIPSLQKMGFTTGDLFSQLRPLGFDSFLIERSGALTAIGPAEIDSLVQGGRYIDVVWRRV